MYHLIPAYFTNMSDWDDAMPNKSWPSHEYTNTNVSLLGLHVFLCLILYSAVIWKVFLAYACVEGLLRKYVCKCIWEIFLMICCQYNIKQHNENHNCFNAFVPGHCHYWSISLHWHVIVGLLICILLLSCDSWVCEHLSLKLN